MHRGRGGRTSCEKKEWEENVGRQRSQMRGSSSPSTPTHRHPPRPSAFGHQCGGGWRVGGPTEAGAGAGRRTSRRGGSRTHGAPPPGLPPRPPSSEPRHHPTRLIAAPGHAGGWRPGAGDGDAGRRGGRDQRKGPVAVHGARPAPKRPPPRQPPRAMQRDVCCELRAVVPRPNKEEKKKNGAAAPFSPKSVREKRLPLVLRPDPLCFLPGVTLPPFPPCF